MRSNEVLQVVRKKDLYSLHVVCFGVVGDFLCGAEITDELYVDGVCFISKKYIKKLRSTYSQSDLINRFFESLGESFLNEVDLLRREYFAVDDVYKYLMNKNIVAVHLERKFVNNFYVGIILRCSDRFVELRAVDLEGHFLDEPVVVKKSQITKIEYKTRYLRALNIGLVGSDIL